MLERLQSLDGRWIFGKDADTAVPAWVPGSMQEAIPFFDGIGEYWRQFSLEASPYENGTVFLEFQKVDFRAEVWLNDCYLGVHYGGEEVFSFDVTAHIQKENKLRVRVWCPDENAVDGITLPQTPHRNKVNIGVQPGQSIDTGGILGHVQLRMLPPVYIEDLSVRPDYETGVAKTELTLCGGTDETLAVTWCLYQFGDKTPLMQKTETVSVLEGQNFIRREFAIRDYKQWSVNSPNLYVLQVTAGEHGFTCRFGFRKLEVKNGYFHLNGERIFLKCSHTGNVFPGGLITSRDMDMMRRDFIYAKTCGFNTIRFMAAMATEEQLDLCDELGMMVYDETMAGWNLEESDKMQQWYGESVAAMLRRDRHHPCVTICGFLNETKYGSVYETARDYLPTARSLAPDILFLLSSGRWDGETGVGSVANPGSSRWECQWGLEGSEKKVEPCFDAPYASYVPGLGDQHLYPPFPQSREIDDFLLHLGEKEKPVLLSEYGHGSQNNVVQEYRKFLQYGMDETAEDASVYRQMMEDLDRAFADYGMDCAYNCLEDFLNDTMRAHAALRLKNLDCVRANPKFCGYNITGLLDHALTGEGLWTYWRELKPEIADVLRDGWAPLRYSVLVDDKLLYPGRQMRIRAFLCNEDVLKPGTYSATMRIRGPHGPIWEKKIDLHLPEFGYGDMPPLAVPMLDESMAFSEPGDYEFSIQMDRAAPLGGRRKFRVGAPLEGDFKVYAVGVEEKTAEKLRMLGLFVVEGLPVEAATVLVGSMEDLTVEQKRDMIYALTKRILQGCNVIFLCPQVFKKDDCNEAFLPLKQKGYCYSFYNWLYHLDGICRRDGVLQGLSDGILDSFVFGQAYPDCLFEKVQAPDETECAMMGCGLPRDGGTYTGIALGAYNLGNGKMILNSFRIVENLGQIYAADALLLNLIRKYQVQGVLTALPEDAEEILNRIEK